jgi:uncharacterized protein YlxW (UPF0749 family)
MDISTLWAALIALLVSLSPKLIEYLVNRKKSNADVHLTTEQTKLIESDIVSKFQSITEKTADENMELRDRVSKLEKEVAALRDEVSKYQQRASAFENWSQRLCAQVVSLGEEPRSFLPKQSQEKEKNNE